jgi:hypothetical protein
MRADLLQSVSVACYGNAYLASGEDRAPEVSPGNPAFRNIATIGFERGGDGLFKGKIAENIAPWLKRMQRESADEIKLFVESVPIDPKQAANFGITTDGDAGLELWTPYWSPKVMTVANCHAARISYVSSRHSRLLQTYRTPIEQEAEKVVKDAWQAAMALEGLDTHTETVKSILTEYLGGVYKFEGYEKAFPDKMNKKAYALASLSTRLCLLMSTPEWTGPSAQRAGGEELAQAATKIWAAGLLGFRTVVNWCGVEAELIAA